MYYYFSLMFAVGLSMLGARTSYTIIHSFWLSGIVEAIACYARILQRFCNDIGHEESSDWDEMPMDSWCISITSTVVTSRALYLAGLYPKSHLVGGNSSGILRLADVEWTKLQAGSHLSMSWTSVTTFFEADTHNLILLLLHYVGLSLDKSYPEVFCQPLRLYPYLVCISFLLPIFAHIHKFNNLDILRLNRTLKWSDSRGDAPQFSGLEALKVFCLPYTALLYSLD